jgi:hypothetical protein
VPRESLVAALVVRFDGGFRLRCEVLGALGLGRILDLIVLGGDGEWESSVLSSEVCLFNALRAGLVLSGGERMAELGGFLVNRLRCDDMSDASICVKGCGCKVQSTEAARK